MVGLELWGFPRFWGLDSILGTATAGIPDPFQRGPNARTEYYPQQRKVPSCIKVWRCC
jgi:hypothetical protein